MTSIRDAEKQGIGDFAAAAQTITVAITSDLSDEDLCQKGIDHDIRGQVGFILEKDEARLNDPCALWVDFTYDYYPLPQSMPWMSVSTTFNVPRQWIQKLTV